MQASGINKAITILTFAAGLLLNADRVCSQPYVQESNAGTVSYGQQQYAAYPSSSQYANLQTASPREVPVYTASREMLPTNPTISGGQSIPANTETTASVNPFAEQKSEAKKDNPFTAFYKKVTKSMKPNPGRSATSQQNNEMTPPDAPTASITEKESTGKKESYIASIFKPSSNNKEDIDDGQDLIAEMEQEHAFSEKDYVDSATKAKKAASKNLYAKGMEEEVAGNYQEAVRSYNGFIKVNKKQTMNGTLAAPYHRLALIAWKQREADKAEIYFRYGLKYAQGGNIPVIAGDYSLFLLDQGRLEQAEIILRNTLLHYPKDQRLILSLGRCVARRDKPVEAMRHLSQVLGEEQACQELAMVYHEKGDYELARQMQSRREELIAQKSRLPYPVAPDRPDAGRQRGGTPQIQTSVAGTPLPTTPPPVMENPRSMTTHATLRSTIPFPTLSDPAVPSAAPKERVDSLASPIPRTDPMPIEPTTEASFNVVPANGPENVWEAPKAPSMPVSRVFHYPANSPRPVYHQYIGDQYPQTFPSVVSGETSQIIPPSGYYMISTVPPMGPNTLPSNTVPMNASYQTNSGIADQSTAMNGPTAAVAPAVLPSSVQNEVGRPWTSSVSQPFPGGYPPTNRPESFSAQPVYQY